ncbi:GAP family protein [Rhodococcus sp. IEGM 1379]|uniref:GAP family protein n=1 Tax=Rhodococcus sp. IEGM 1379 TaxID=3047086 RepID=UPI0024B7B801|nr:GAP family protein [Rhodococcus sp. IEGM 1379]MDI9916601.1 GAP family protein [Rhodococcus sp. IEGM 1379]
MESITAQLIPLATGIIISPIPLVAIIAILLSVRSKANAFAYTASIAVAAAAITAATAFSTTGVASAKSGGGHTVQTVFAVVFTAGFLALAYSSWRGRPKGDAEPALPSWLAQIDTMQPAKAAVLGLLLTVPNAKNLPLELKAGSIIGGDHLSWVGILVYSVLFAVVASIALIILSALAAVPSERVTATLSATKTALIQHNSAIMTALFLMLAALELSHVVEALSK